MSCFFVREKAWKSSLGMLTPSQGAAQSITVARVRSSLREFHPSHGNNPMANLSPSFPPLLFHVKFHLLKGSSRIRRIIEKERRLTFSLFFFFNTCPDSLLFTTSNQSIDFVFCLGKVSFQSIDHGC